MNLTTRDFGEHINQAVNVKNVAAAATGNSDASPVRVRMLSPEQ